MKERTTKELKKLFNAREGDWAVTTNTHPQNHEGLKTCLDQIIQVTDTMLPMLIRKYLQ